MQVLKVLREKTDFVKAEVAKKKWKVDVDASLEADVKHREAISEYEQLSTEQKRASDEVPLLDKSWAAFTTNVAALK
jgi:seryl-tRNA synthetase